MKRLWRRFSILDFTEFDKQLAKLAELRDAYRDVNNSFYKDRQSGFENAS